jgi:hypothetical protein
LVKADSAWPGIVDGRLVVRHSEAGRDIRGRWGTAAADGGRPWVAGLANSRLLRPPAATLVARALGRRPVGSAA